MCGYTFVRLYSLMLVRMVGSMCKYMIQIAVWSVCVNAGSSLVYAYVCLSAGVFVCMCVCVCTITCLRRTYLVHAMHGISVGGIHMIYYVWYIYRGHTM